MPQLYTYARFFPPYFSCPFCRFSILVFLSFSFIFSTPSWKWRPTLFVLELRHLFLWSSGHSVQKIVKLLKKSERWPNKWSKVKTLEDKPRSGWPFFHKLCEKYYRKSCKYMRNNSTKQKGDNGMGISYQKKLESLEEKKAVHTSCKHGVRRIFQLYTKGGPAGKLMWCETSRDHLDYRRRDRLEHTKIQSPKHRTSYDSDYASPGRMWLWTRFGSSYILYLAS